MTILVNLFGGPGSGKSTTAAHTFAELKHRGINAELVTEFAKDKVWEKSFNVLGNQPYIVGKQFHRLWRLKDEVDVIVTDSPLLLCLYYGNGWGQVYDDYVMMLHNHFDSMNYFLNRVKKYNPSGRMQTEDQAKAIDNHIRQILEKHDVNYTEYLGEKHSVYKITADVIQGLES